MQLARATASEFEARVRQQSASTNTGVADNNWNLQIARAEFSSLNSKLKKQYGHDLIPLLKELEASGIVANDLHTPAQNEDFVSMMWMSAIATVSILVIFYYLFSYFNEDMEPHMRSLLFTFRNGPTYYRLRILEK